MIYKTRIKVESSGYWFTAGGAKGSFGYYPHLRNTDNLPIYPDTQLHGNLKMAARWLCGLGEIDSGMVTQLFGSGSDESGYDSSKPSKIFCGDLVLTKDSASKWGSDRFEVKARIRINETTHTVEEHFLVDLEMARLEGLTLEAPIYLKIEEDQFGKATAIINNAAQLLSGFGAFRSRGYGRCANIEISDWEPLTTQAGKKELTGRRRYALTALTNVRNKIVDPGNAQVLSTSRSISTAQLRGWLARAYKDKYGAWPQPEKLNAVEISPLYPAPDPDTLAWPAPMSTLKDADGTIKDQWGVKRDEPDAVFFTGKSSPLGADYTVTEKNEVWQISGQQRVRNNIDNNFLTTLNGLFVQEFLPAGIIFSGTLCLNGLDDEFADQISDILTNNTPIINGALFKTSVGLEVKKSSSQPNLLTAEIPFQPNPINGNDHTTMGQGSSIRIATARGYNTTLKRPRRARVVMQPGSILTTPAPFATPWGGFTKQLSWLAPAKTTTPGKANTAPAKETIIKLSKEQKNITRAQAGLLRAMLHPALSKDAIIQNLEHRIDKYQGRDNMSGIRKMLKDILTLLNDEKHGGLAVMRREVDQILEQIALARWQPKRVESNNNKHGRS